jgi:hypothetical protein
MELSRGVSHIPQVGPDSSVLDDVRPHACFLECFFRHDRISAYFSPENARKSSRLGIAELCHGADTGNQPDLGLCAPESTNRSDCVNGDYKRGPSNDSAL